MRCGIKNLNISRPVRQIPRTRETIAKEKLIVETSSTIWYGLVAVLKRIFMLFSSNRDFVTLKQNRSFGEYKNNTINQMKLATKVAKSQYVRILQSKRRPQKRVFVYFYLNIFTIKGQLVPGRWLPHAERQQTIFVCRVL